ncbi:radical SAM protein [Streptomyces phaeochromogenes]|uniref:radical SAM protein n=1 Tax=Streptomyces phaeochromogenes TaxID=1923 RepID=UPI0038642FD5|nr:radical SAM protein [Streptomyces phaeochromogenes]WSW21046.1 radical SAM protein [Streptomyces phaeochromogenes]
MAVSLPMPSIGPPPDTYGHARMPAPGSAPVPEKIDRIEYGRFRNVYVYITEACQLRCSGCYMGDRLERALKMPFEQIQSTLTSWRQMGGSKLTVLGGEPTLHPRYEDTIRLANVLGYEHVITTSNGLAPARRKFERLESADFAYVQISLDGGSATTHDAVRGKGKFDETLVTVKELCERGFDTRIICTVSKRNERDCLRLLDLADEIGVSLVKYHVLSVIGRGHGSPEDGMEPPEWLEFCDRLRTAAQGYRTRVWYQPTFARRTDMPRFEAEGYRGCIGRTLDRISIFPDGRAYVCSFLFDTDLHFAEMREGRIELNRRDNEFDLFTGALTTPGCGGCKAPGSCMGGCPAEQIVDGRSSCDAYEDIVPVCRLWKSVPAN